MKSLSYQRPRQDNTTSVEGFINSVNTEIEPNGNVRQEIEALVRDPNNIIKQHYTLNYPQPPDRRWSPIDSTGGVTTDLMNKVTTFKKVLFTRDVHIVDSTTSADTINHLDTLVSAGKDSLIQFENCVFNGTITSTATTTNIFNCDIDTSASTSTIQLLIDSNGQLITTRDGVIQWYGESLTKKDALKHKIRRQLAPIIRSRSADRGRQFANVTQPEIVALHLLRQMVSEESFKKYLKHGFVTVEGPSGLVYQIIRKGHNMYVWKNGQKVASLCVYLKDNTIPPTDEVVAKILICQCDEIDIWRRANISWINAMSEFKKLRRDSIQEKHILKLAV